MYTEVNELSKKINQKSSFLHEIKEKILNNQRLSKQDGINLYNSYDILSIGILADLARINRLQDKAEKDYVYWINNHHLNLTNVCEGKCKFCAYRRDEGQDGAFSYSLDKAVEYLKMRVDRGVKEIHIVSALNPEFNLDFYKNLLAECRKILPDTHIQAFTAVEIDYIARISGFEIKKVLQELKDTGLGSIPGGGAEIFSENIRQQVCPKKISGQRWLEVMEVAHNLGLKSNVTMLTGIGESSEDKINHMLAARELQDKTGGFMTFIPLFCHYENTELSVQNKPTGIDILKDYAVSRLMLDNIPHIKAFHIQTGIKLAQVSLGFGVDDIDGTVTEEKITRMAGSKNTYALKKKEIEHLITRAGKIPVERDTVYNLQSCSFSY